jgi:hypothetical protein
MEDKLNCLIQRAVNAGLPKGLAGPCFDKGLSILSSEKHPESVDNFINGDGKLFLMTINAKLQADFIDCIDNMRPGLMLVKMDGDKS